jgi:undecaprenyl-diphosphatase
VQGLTEFLPVSSSGHLVAARALAGVATPGAALEVWLHLGTLLPVVIVYRQAFADMARGLVARDEGGRGRAALAALVVATAPAAAVGLLARDSLEAAFASPRVAALGLLGTTALLASLAFVPAARRAGGRAGTPAPAPLRAAIVGLAQALALVPGLSRSGSTIVAGRWLGLAPDEAAAFSFLLSVPAVLGAALVEGVSHGLGGIGPAAALSGFGAAAVSGYAALALVRRLVVGGRLGLFAPYTLAVAVAVLWRL